jgi:hypothetical protein
MTPLERSLPPVWEENTGGKVFHAMQWIETLADVSSKTAKLNRRAAYEARLDDAVAHGWLVLHESGTFRRGPVRLIDSQFPASPAILGGQYETPLKEKNARTPLKVLGNAGNIGRSVLCVLLDLQRASLSDRKPLSELWIEGIFRLA